MGSRRRAMACAKDIVEQILLHCLSESTSIEKCSRLPMALGNLPYQKNNSQKEQYGRF
jgi:hypothetical protein